MSKIFAAIGIAAVAILAIYFCIVKPINAYQELEHKYYKLDAQYDAKCEELDQTYDNFYRAINSHASSEVVRAIYQDPRYFDSETSFKNKKFKTNINNY